jgi:hypothetical protein
VSSKTTDKCPSCGSTLKSKNLDKQIDSILLSRSKEYGKLYEYVKAEVNRSRTVQLSSREIHSFLNSTKECDEEMAIISMNQYIENNVAREGKGLPYLAAIINNSTMTKKSKKEHEFKMLDRIPPRIDRG